MNIASEIKTRQEFDDLKAVMEIFIVNNRVKELARAA